MYNREIIRAIVILASDYVGDGNRKNIAFYYKRIWALIVEIKIGIFERRKIYLKKMYS